MSVDHSRKLEIGSSWLTENHEEMPILLGGVAIDRSLILQSEPSKRTEIAATESLNE